MARLFVLSGPDVGATFDVDQAAVIGRSPECDVRLSDGSIGRRHARLERQGRRWHLIDLGSANGIRHGGERVEEVVLVDLEEVQLGRVRLRFREDLPAGDGAEREASPRTDSAAGGLELEEEIDLERLAPRTAKKVGPPARPRQAPASAAPNRPGASAMERRAEVLRADAGRGGLLTDALEDRPLWISLLLVAVVLALGGGLAYGVFRFVVGLRAG